MISLQHLQKHYNKGKPNEIHVIDDTTLEFPEKGLVAITGPSGCGKTTLLNIIGGLDRFESGQIVFDGLTISSYNNRLIDEIRNSSIGYIFQNYNLITDKTVYENVEIALNMAGLFDKKPIEERVNYVLRSVGMYNYRKRNVLALSGGQQQRVAIARAIAKNPKVVLADEPTGNLDANNTFEIMGIIKKISQSCLVILVSHERDLVDFYADRVVELHDGKVVNDYLNEGNRTLEHVDDRNIYLLDLEKETAKEPIDIAFYHSGNPPKDIGLRVIHFNNTVYIKADAKTKVKYLTEDSEIRLLDQHYRKPETEDIDKSAFDLTQFTGIVRDPRHRSFIRFGDTLVAGVKKVFSRRKFFQRLFLIAYFFVSCLIVYNLASFGNLTEVDESEFLNVAQNLVAVTLDDEIDYADIQAIVADTDADAVSPYSAAVQLTAYVEDFYQGSGANVYGTSFAAFPVPESQLDDYELIAGSLPVDNTGAAIDAWIADDLLATKAILDLGITAYKDLIGAEIRIGYSDTPLQTLEITGIIVSAAPVVVVTDANILIFTKRSDFSSHGTAVGRYEIVDGRDIEGPAEILVPEYMIYSLGDVIIFEDTPCEIVGIVNSEFSIPFILSDDIAETMVVAQLFESGSEKLLFYTDDIDSTVSQLTELGYEAEDAYNVARAEYVAELRSEVAGRITSILVTLGGIIVYVFLMTRSSMLGRIKEIGIYRSIGATKNDIYKIFLAEILALTTIGSLTGYLLMTYIVNRIEQALSGVMSIFHLTIPLFLAGIVGIYAINIVFGMLPIFTLLRKTPSEINAKYDI
jgi:ABC-type lipoprotein export system ATPase subunit/ABC-type antimicrobial peptide transport system permease subunit